MKSNVNPKNQIDEVDLQNRQMVQGKIKNGLNHLVQQIDFRKTNYNNEEIAKNVLEDPSIYDYDGNYDLIQERRKQVEENKKKQLIQAKGTSLLEQRKAAMSRRDLEVKISIDEVNKKMLAKEGKEQTQKYVTESYKRQIEESQKYLVQQKVQDEYDKKHSQQNVSNFYKSLYEQEIFQGKNRIDFSQDVEKSETKQKNNSEKTNQKQENGQISQNLNIQTDTKQIQNDTIKNEKILKTQSKTRSRSRSKENKRKKESLEINQNLKQQKQQENSDQKQQSQNFSQSKEEKQKEKLSKVELLKQRYKERQQQQTGEQEQI